MTKISHFLYAKLIYIFFPFSVVEFRSRADMKAALERLNGQDLNGREVSLREVWLPFGI